MLLAGMDVSGNKAVGNYKYLAIVLGTKENIESLHNKINPFGKRMTNVFYKDQSKIIEELIFDQKNRIAFCIKLDRTKIIEEVKNKRTTKRKRTPDGNIIRTFNYVVIRKVLPKITEFALTNSTSLMDVEFECDSDCQPFAKTGNLKHTIVGSAHSIADKVAWCNNKGTNLSTVIELDFTGEIVDTMTKILKL